MNITLDSQVVEQILYQYPLINDNCFQKIFDLYSDLILIFDIDRHILLANMTCIRFIGKEYSEILGKRDDQVFDTPFIGAYTTFFKESIHKNQATTGKIQATLGGQSYTFHITFIPFINRSTGEINIFAAFHHDNRRSHHYYKLINTSRDAISSFEGSRQNSYCIDTNYHIVLFNDAASNTASSQLNRTIKNGDLILDYIPEYDHDLFISHYQQALQGATNDYNKTFVISDYRYTYHFLFTPIYTSDNIIVGVLYTCSSTVSRTTQ